MSNKHIIRPDPISWTTHHVHICFTKTDLVISSGTGFIYRSSDEYFLITNWHNVSGKNPVTGQHLADSLAVPDVLSSMFREKSEPGRCHRESLRLYADEEMLKPLWFVHPEHGPAVDVVALPLSSALLESYRLFPINDVKFDDGVSPEVADDVYVVGYPSARLPTFRCRYGREAVLHLSRISILIKRQSYTSTLQRDQDCQGHLLSYSALESMVLGRMDKCCPRVHSDAFAASSACTRVELGKVS
jgi:hypothetical protein